MSRATCSFLRLPPLCQPAEPLIMKVLLFANTEWFMYNFNRSLAIALREQGHEVVLVTPPGSYGEKLRELGFRWIAAPMQRRSLNLFRELSLLLWLRRLFISERVTLVHSFTIKCAIYGSLAARLAGVPARVNAVTGMGYVFTNNDLKARLLRPLVHRLMKWALDGQDARLILLNRDDFSFFNQSKLIDPNLIRMLPGAGIDCKRFTPPESSGIREKFRVVLPARMLWDKGVAEYVDAARMLRAEGRAIEFLLAGAPDPGNPAAVPEQRIHGWVKEGVVSWLGHVDDMPSLFRSVDVVVVPSYREGLPTGLTEAGACALPLVTTDVPGCREVVTHDVDGLLVPVRDARALADALARLQDDPDLCKRLGAAARKKALAEFDKRIVNTRTLTIYDELTK